ncbi:UDP-N-acetylglucosamine 2-epimerase (non-hydrolyzing) [Sphingomonas sp. SM33]|uniref:UDP-N-acetylglucosamine 2-epimerase (non-hydrolyzing) n=1 Tax=Sphingomonas telluris TaxID=2907998 RepID=A0ABS9VHU9_9SPHN|nr:UDP-N-acetylglucosamine 2-epimerase (non-hydrolyzing) [Sphingomonas telluris]
MKLAPVADALARRGIPPSIVLTGQHPHLNMDEYGLGAFQRLELHCQGQANPHVYVGSVARELNAAIEGSRLVVVQGDTSSALGGALGATQACVPVAHVEAGLRTHDRANPWPEEDFRVAIDAHAELLFAPTETSASNLRQEGVSGEIIVTGNTAIDALLKKIPLLREPRRNGGKRLLVTCHRRESWGEPLRAIADCLVDLADRGIAHITFVLHPNPKVAGEMRCLLGEQANINLLEPCSHLEMLQLMTESDLVLSDSGGMQEEAPTLGVPLLVLRDRTERPEGVTSGNALVVGRDAERIRMTVETLLADAENLRRMRVPAFPMAMGGQGIESRMRSVLGLGAVQKPRAEPRLRPPRGRTNFHQCGCSKRGVNRRPWNRIAPISPAGLPRSRRHPIARAIPRPGNSTPRWPNATAMPPKTRPCRRHGKRGPNGRSYPTTSAFSTRSG